MIALAWNPSLVCSDLQKSCVILNERCLKLAAKWAAEQWMGLPQDIISTNALVSNDSTSPSTILDELELNKSPQNRNNPGLHYARTLLELGEYAHAAAVLSQTKITKAASVEHGMPPPIPGLTPAAIYLRAYALYLAGERRKEEDRLVDNCYGDNSANSRSTSTR
jgi:anaphase-promoting complex subunit 8